MSKLSRRQFLYLTGASIATLAGCTNKNDNKVSLAVPSEIPATPGTTTIAYLQPTSRSSYEVKTEDDRGLEVTIQSLERNATGDLFFQKTENGRTISYTGFQENGLKEAPPAPQLPPLPPGFPPLPPPPQPPIGDSRHTQLGGRFIALEGGASVRVYEFTNFLVDPFDPAASFNSVAAFTFRDVATGEEKQVEATVISPGHETYIYNGSNPIFPYQFEFRVEIPTLGADPNAVDLADNRSGLKVDQNGDNTFAGISGRPPTTVPQGFENDVHVLGETKDGILFDLDPDKRYASVITPNTELALHVPRHPALLGDTQYKFAALNTRAGEITFETDPNTFYNELGMQVSGVNGSGVVLPNPGRFVLSQHLGSGVVAHYRLHPKHGNLEVRVEQ